MSTALPVLSALVPAVLTLAMLISPLTAAEGEAAGAEAEQSQMVTHATDFLLMVNQVNLFAVKTSEMAIMRNVPAEVHEFAEAMVMEHAQADAELNDLAGEHGVTVSAIFDQTWQAKYDALAQTPDTEFVTAYLQSHIATHRDTIAVFKTMAERGNDPQIKAMIADKLPKLEAHLGHAERLADTL